MLLEFTNPAEKNDTQVLMLNLKNHLKLKTEQGMSRAHSVRSGAVHYPGLCRRDGMKVLIEVFGMSVANASTTYHNYYARKLRIVKQIAVEPAIAYPQNTTLIIDLIRISLSESANYSATVFKTCTALIDRNQFLRPKGIVDAGQGCVYAYFNGEQALYVGITGSRVKSRLTTPTSPHIETDWWPDWTHMRFLPLESASDRQILEHLLILGLAPTANRKPGAASIDHFLNEMEAPR